MGASAPIFASDHGARPNRGIAVSRLSIQGRNLPFGHAVAPTSAPSKDDPGSTDVATAMEHLCHHPVRHRTHRY